MLGHRGFALKVTLESDFRVKNWTLRSKRTLGAKPFTDLIYLPNLELSLHELYHKSANMV
ncbi:unnamed protein product [marine sediment metagenome]|uniref:Uncharacterized protein n=1 Tax=marine sediment metagenome TaxID=412755 RepID=X1B421_9ZZZZ